MDRCQISYVKFILEAYDNVAVMSTLDPRQGLVQVAIAPGCETLVKGIMNSLAAERLYVVAVDHASPNAAASAACRWQPKADSRREGNDIFQ